MLPRGFGRYEVRQEIGRGGMARVYLAYDPTFRRPVAVKVLPPHFLDNPLLRARFEREARLIATIEHPAIVPVYDFGEQDEQLFLVMRYMPGGSLAAMIQHGPLPLDRAAGLLSSLAPALDAVHARGIVHRDLKPANILLDAFDNPALSDFGIAHLSEATVELTGEAIIGTPAYMSPEQVRGEADLDGRSDVYSLGIILFEMLSGRQPFQASTPMSAAMRHLTEPVPQIHLLKPDLPEALQDVLNLALAKDRDKRYKRATDLVSDLRTLADARSSKVTLAPLPDAGSPQAVGAARGLGTQPYPEEPSSISAPPSTAPTELEPASIESLAAPVSASISSADPAGEHTAQRTSRVRSGWLAIIPAVCLLVILAFLGARAMLPNGSSATQPAALAIASVTPRPEPSQTSRPFATPTRVEAPSPTGVKTAGPTLQPVLLPTPVFYDDFSAPANGWPEGEEAGGGYRYQDGEYMISALENGSLYWAAPEASYSDSRMSVEANRVSGDLGYYGVMCRIQDADHYYYFIIRPDGYFTIGKYEAGSFVLLTSGGWTYAPTIQNGDAANLIETECNGDHLRLYANGALLGETRDSAFTSGKPGLVVAALDEQGFQAGFDNFTIRSPAP